MNKTTAVKIVQEYANVVKTYFDYKKIILFGSYAKGNFHEFEISNPLVNEIMRYGQEIVNF